MEKPILACFAKVLSVNDESIWLKPDMTKKVIWGLYCDGRSLSKDCYVDPDIPAYVGQYVGVVSVPNEEEEYRLKLVVYDANSPAFLELVAEELAQLEEKDNKTAGKARQ